MNEKHVMVSRYDSGKRYFLISARLRQEVGALSDFTKILAVRGIDVLEGHIYVSREPEGYVTFFAEAKDKRIDSRFINQLLKGSSYLEGLTVVESRRGLIVDSVNFPLMTGAGRRSVLLSADSVREVFHEAVRKYGDPAREMIYWIGFSYGKDTWQTSFGGIGFDKQDLQEYLEVYSAIGMGRPFLEKLKGEVPVARVAVEHCFECEGRRGDRPESIFMSGVLAGSFTVAFGRDMVARESQCVAMGSKRCIFEVVSRQ